MHIGRREFLISSAITAGLLGSRPMLASAEAVKKEPDMLNLGFMAWRIGEILDFDAQAQWVREAGFESIGFHASAGTPGRWRGVAPESADAAERKRLRALLEPFATREIHAPFEAKLEPETSQATLDMLERTFAFAHDVGADVVTVHVNPPPLDGAGPAKAWHDALDQLDRAAGKAGIRVGLEFMQGFEWLKRPHREHIGATLDVGHMYLNDGAGYRPYGTIGNLVRTLEDTLVHVHVHDYDGTHDHSEIGTGIIDFDDFLQAIRGIGYKGMMCLELNPDWVSPEAIVRSAESLRTHARKLKES